MKNEDIYIGRLFGNYRVEDELKCGSFGCTYLARHVYLNRVATIKLLLIARLHSVQDRKRFLREAQFLGRLDHPHILTIYEFGIDNDFPYLVTEYAPGGSLRDLLHRYRRRRLPVKDAITILSQVGNALHYTHQQGIIHHDIKPENILLNTRGEALLADFGIAMVQRSIITRRATASIGTPAYMAPELFHGTVSAKSDQYALGCVGYELLTGRTPFTAPSVIAMALKHMQEKPVPPSELNPLIPLYVEQAILKALEKRRINRHKDVLSFNKALQTPFPDQPRVPIRSQQMLLIAPRRTKEQWLQASNTLRELKRYEEALLADEQAISLDPAFPPAHSSKGITLYYLKRYDEALAAFEHALRLDPYFAQAHSNKGSVFYRLKRYDEALAAYEAAIHNEPDEALFHYYKGNVLWRLGRTREAQQAYERARQLDNGE